MLYTLYYIVYYLINILSTVVVSTIPHLFTNNVFKTKDICYVEDDCLVYLGSGNAMC